MFLNIFFLATKICDFFLPTQSLKCLNSCVSCVSPDLADGSASHRQSVFGVVTVIDLLSYINANEKQEGSLSELPPSDNGSL